MLLVIAVILSVAYRRCGIESVDDTRVVYSTFYCKRIDIATMRLAQARVVDLDEHTELRPARKSNGFAFPGFWSGHMRLPDRSKAFCLVTDASHVLAIPLHDGSRLLLSPERPRQLLQDLQQLAATHATA